mmetsp:Transcript_1571/g.3312  ORF Transcript_1571/g.3312 Transcript_1571/m.3312 type:complete len:224 (-) Transcript_1571:360-1031(-)
MDNLTATGPTVHNWFAEETSKFLQRISSMFETSTHQFSGTEQRPISTDYVLLGGLILAAFELLNFLVKFFGHRGWYGKKKTIPVRGMHLDDLSEKDYLFIGFNKAATPLFVYFFVRYMYHEKNIIWDMNEVNSVSFLDNRLPHVYVRLITSMICYRSTLCYRFQCCFLCLTSSTPYSIGHYTFKKSTATYTSIITSKKLPAEQTWTLSMFIRSNFFWVNTIIF